MSMNADWGMSCLRDRRGGVAMIFGLAITVLFCVIGFAVDFSRSHAAKQSAQGAMDAAMMSAARKETVNDQIVEDTIETYLALSDSMKHGASAVSTAGRVLDNGTTVEGEAVLRVPTRLLNVMGYPISGS